MSKSSSGYKSVKMFGKPAIYSGEMKDTLRYGLIPHGHGTLKYQNDEKFIGSFKNGYPVQGTYYWTNGCRADVKYSYNFDHSQYETFYYNCAHDEITHAKTIKYGNGTYYGQVDGNGNPHGIGKYTWDSGDCYEGGWLNDKRHGVGKYTYDDGDYDYAIWDNDTKIKVFQKYRKDWYSRPTYNQSSCDDDYDYDDYNEQDTPSHTEQPTQQQEYQPRSKDSDEVARQFNLALNAIFFNCYTDAEYYLEYVCDNAHDVNDYTYNVNGCEMNARSLLDWARDQKMLWDYSDEY